MIGPACAKLSLYLSKSYSNNIDEIVSVEEVDSEGKKKSEVDILIDKIKKIQETIPKSEEMSEEEKAFNEAAYENYYNNYNNFSRNRKMHGR